MFILIKETLIDDSYSAYDEIIACSKNLETLENLEKTFYAEKEEFLESCQGLKSTFEVNQEQFLKMKTLSKYFRNYLDVCNGYFYFVITETEEI